MKWLLPFSLSVLLSVAVVASCAERTIKDYGPYPTRGQAGQQTATKQPSVAPGEGTSEAEVAAESEPAVEPAAEPEPAKEAVAIAASEPPSIDYQQCDEAGGNCTVVAAFRDLDTCRRFQVFQSVSCTCKSSAKGDCWAEVAPDTEIICKACVPGDESCRPGGTLDRCGSE